MSIGINSQQAPELRVPYWIDGDGHERAPLTLAELGDGYKVIYCFQHWCPGCHSRGFPTLKKLVKELSDLPLRIEIDDRSISVSSKLKRAHQDFVPHKIVIGQQEVDDNYKDLKKLAKNLAKEMAGKPFIRREWGAEVSRQL